jgi:hypothetical protein
MSNGATDRGPEPDRRKIPSVLGQPDVDLRQRRA